jgi:deoxyribonucleoside regulator
VTRQRRTALSEDESLLLAEVAQLYYLKDFTQEQIAQRIGVSRSNVSRMLKEAREQGMVEISIHSPLRTASGLQAKLVERLGLRECLVLANLDLDSRIFEATDNVSQVAALAARYLQENTDQGDVVGLGWSRSVHYVVRSRFLREKQDVTVVQLMGSIGGSITELDGIAVTAFLADVWGASAHYLHTPMLVTEAAVRDGLLRDPHISKTLEIARRADSIVVGVGSMDEENGQYRTGYCSKVELDYIRDKGGVAEVCGSYLSRDGSLVPLEMHERMIAIGFEEIKAIPNRIGVSSGSHKPLANIGAARSGLLNVLITDDDTARKMLDVLDDESSASPATSGEAQADKSRH